MQLKTGREKMNKHKQYLIQSKNTYVGVIESNVLSSKHSDILIEFSPLNFVR